MKRQKGRPPIDPEILIYIEDSVLRNRFLEPEKRVPKKELARILEKEIPQELKKTSPTFETLRKKITDASKKDLPSLDNCWSIVAMAKHYIPHDAVLTVLRAYMVEYIIEINKGRPLSRPPLTIREALWVARLSQAIKDIGILIKYAKEYAMEERIYEALGKVPDSSARDYEVLCHLKDEICADLDIDLDSINRAFPPIHFTEIRKEGE